VVIFHKVVYQRRYSVVGVFNTHFFPLSLDLSAYVTMLQLAGELFTVLLLCHIYPLVC